MALYPAATYRPIPPGANDPKIIARGWILHKAATNSTSLFGYFNGPSGGIESHFYIRKDGHVEQYRDTAWEADANYHGNHFELNGKLYGYLSVETQGLADDPWTDEQLREIKKLLLWGREVHSIPLVKCISATAPGVGYHTMWGAPGPWTPVAKDCPGKYSIAQFNNNLVPWFSNPVSPEDDMQWNDSVPDFKETDGTDLSLREAALRGNTAYGWLKEGGASDKRLDKIEAALADLPAPSAGATDEQRLAALEAFVTKLKGALS